MTRANRRVHRRGARAPATIAALLTGLLAQALAPVPAVVQGGGVSPAVAQGTKPAPDAKPPAAQETKVVTPAIENGSTVQLEYTLKDDAGAVLDSNHGQEPLTYVHGQHQIVPGLEQSLGGMHAGDQRSVTVSAKDGYGATDPSAVVEVPKQLIPPDALVPGTWLTAQRQDGGARLVKVKEVREQTVILDLNHPLAGQNLHFDVKILGVAPPAKP